MEQAPSPQPKWNTYADHNIPWWRMARVYLFVFLCGVIRIFHRPKIRPIDISRWTDATYRKYRKAFMILVDLRNDDAVLTFDVIPFSRYCELKHKVQYYEQEHGMFWGLTTDFMGGYVLMIKGISLLRILYLEMTGNGGLAGYETTRARLKSDF